VRRQEAGEQDVGDRSEEAGEQEVGDRSEETGGRGTVRWLRSVSSCERPEAQRRVSSLLWGQRRVTGLIPQQEDRLLPPNRPSTPPPNRPWTPPPRRLLPGLDVVKQVLPALVDGAQLGVDLRLLRPVGRDQLLPQLLQVGFTLTEGAHLLHAVLMEEKEEK